jgi:hypothetical protein
MKKNQEVDQNMSSNFHVDHFAWIATEFEYRYEFEIELNSNRNLRI